MIITNKYGLSQGLLDAVSLETYSKGLSNFSATDLLKPSRIYALEVRHRDKLEEDASDLIYRMIGTIGHSIVERTKRYMLSRLDPEVLTDLRGQQMESMAYIIDQLVGGEIRADELADKITEELDRNENGFILHHLKVLFETRLFATVKVDNIDYVLSGQVDRYDINTGELSDYKIVSKWVVKDQTKDDWVKQLNIYRWLLHKHGWDVQEAYIEAILRDWSKRQAARDPNEIQSQVVRVKIDLWDINKIEEYIVERIRSHVLALSQPENTMVICSPEERWESKGGYAAMKKDRKRAIKLFDTKDEAVDWITKNTRDGETIYIEDRPGESVRCKSYCPVKEHCSFAKYFAKL